GTGGCRPTWTSTTCWWRQSRCRFRSASSELDFKLPCHPGRASSRDPGPIDLEKLRRLLLPLAQRYRAETDRDAVPHIDGADDEREVCGFLFGEVPEQFL